jgi:hypothetical protein
MEVIARVEELAENEKAPLMTDGYPMFEWSPGNVITEEVEILDREVAEENDTIENDVNDEDKHGEVTEVEDDTQSSHDDEEEENDQESMESIDNNSKDEDLSEGLLIIDEENDAHNDDDNNAITNDQDEVDDVMTEDNVDKLEGRANERPRRENAGAGVERLEMSFGTKEYASQSKKQFTMKGVQGIAEKTNSTLSKERTYMDIATNVMFTQMSEYSQMSAKAGIKRFGEQAVAAMWKEYKQLNEGAVPGKPVFGSVDPKSLSFEEHSRALEAVNLIKKKRCGKIKGRTCADGSKQKRYLKEGETISSPTVSTEAIIGTLVIDAIEE